MINLSIFAERLEYLIYERGFATSKDFAATVGIPAATITRYKNAKHLPSVKIIVKLADYFQCSTDYLLGFEEAQQLTFKPCPPFCEQLGFLEKHLGKTASAFYRELDIPESSYFEWKSGEALPTLESVKKIADFLDRRIDFVLGRES